MSDRASKNFTKAGGTDPQTIQGIGDRDGVIVRESDSFCHGDRGLRSGFPLQVHAQGSIESVSIKVVLDKFTKKLGSTTRR